MFMFSSNQPIKVAHLQKLANQSTIFDKTFIDFFTFWHNFFSPEVKQN